MYDVIIFKGYNIFQYLIGIQLCMLAKNWNWKFSKNAENYIFSLNFSSLVSIFSSDIDQQVKVIPNS